MKDFEGLVALVTGGSSGIGAATAALLAERGARVVVLDSQLAQTRNSHFFVRCDITDSQQVAVAVATAADHLGRLDIVINNAGIGAQGDVRAATDDEWRRVLDVNVVGTARVTAAALPHLLQSPHASIVNTCSVVAHVGVPNRAVYAATKGAVHALTLSMAADYVRRGIRVNAVSPGTADTPWVGRLLSGSDDPEQALSALRARQPMRRLVTAEEVSFGIAYLASPLAASTTGTVLVIDGGMLNLRLPS